MNRKMQRHSSLCCFLALISLCTLADSKLVYHRAVQVRCHPDWLEVVVQADLFNLGLQVDGKHLRLGLETAGEGSACRAVPSGEAEFTIRTYLMDCGTKLSSNREKIIYSNVLIYSPEPSSDGLLRLDGASIPVECHYEKRYSVDSISLQPTWVPLVSTASAEDRIDFNLLLMTEDWKFGRGSSSYFLGDPIHLELSAITGNHVPLRVYVDHCVATPTADTGNALRYDFIEYNGCLVDAYMTKSTSRFLPRVEEHKLRFQLDAFKFYQQPNNQVYITCRVKAVPVASAVSPHDRACSLIDNRWRSADGNDQACRNCEVSHQAENPLSTPMPETPSGTKAQSSMTLKESSAKSRPGQSPATYHRYRTGMIQDEQQQSSARLKRGANIAEKSIKLGPIIVLPSSKTD